MTLVHSMKTSKILADNLDLLTSFLFQIKKIINKENNNGSVTGVCVQVILLWERLGCLT